MQWSIVSSQPSFCRPTTSTCMKCSHMTNPGASTSTWISRLESSQSCSHQPTLMSWSRKPLPSSMTRSSCIGPNCSRRSSRMQLSSRCPTKPRRSPLTSFSQTSYSRAKRRLRTLPWLSSTTWTRWNWLWCKRHLTCVYTATTRTSGCRFRPSGVRQPKMAMDSNTTQKSSATRQSWASMENGSISPLQNSTSSRRLQSSA